MNRNTKFATTLLVAGVVSAAVAWMMRDASDTIPKEKYSFLMMTQALSTAKDAANACWTEKRVAVIDCNEVKARMPKPSSPDVNYFVSNEGQLIGIDYAARVVVVLTASVVGGSLTWQCSGAPADSLARSCTPFR